MWSGNIREIRMAEGDYGIALPFPITGVTLTGNDSFRFTFRSGRDGMTALTKDYAADTVNNAVNLLLTAEESARLPAGRYTYSLDWYQDGGFLCNLIAAGAFKVVKK